MFQLVIPFQLELPFAATPKGEPAERRTGHERRAQPRKGRDRRRAASGAR